MRVIVWETNDNVGVYVTVETPSTVHAGGAIKVLEDDHAVSTQREWPRKTIFTVRTTVAMIRAVQRENREARAWDG